MISPSRSRDDAHLDTNLPATGMNIINMPVQNTGSDHHLLKRAPVNATATRSRPKAASSDNIGSQPNLLPISIDSFSSLLFNVFIT